jgi:signal transduction histidine kinase
MSARPPRGTLPIRRWLALALVALIAVPVAVTAVVAFHLVGLPQTERFAAADRLQRDAARWHDPAWQAQMRDEFGPHGIDFVLIENGQEVYRSAPDPLAGADSRAGRLMNRVEFDDDGVQRTVWVYSAVDPTSGRDFWFVPVAGLAVLLLTLGGIAWYIGRTVVAPLAATGEAARRVAAGDLDVALPSSRVREVAEVNAAFAAMSDALRTSLRQQAELEQERRFFIGAIVHDLRTPLFSLRGSLEALETGVADTPEKRARYVGVAWEKAAALERLIADLFDFTRLEYLDQAPNRESLDFAALLRGLVEGVQPRAEAKGVRLTLAHSTEPSIVEGDAHLLSRAIENLLDNAVRYTPGGGSVGVTCASGVDGVTFAVADSGPGIPPHDLPHLFVPLYRGENSRNRRTGGAGLGLTIARRILQAHGGDLTARNTPAGGALFEGTLPTPAPPAPQSWGENDGSRS